MITATRTACLHYTVTTSGADSGVPYELKKLDGTILGTGTTGINEFVLPEEGVYVLTVNSNQYILIDYCELINCIMKLLQSVFCAGESKQCDPCTDKDFVQFRFDLNKLIAGYGALNLAIFHERVTYTNVYQVDACRLANLQRIQAWILDLQKVKGACGDAGCGDADTPASEPCPDC